MFGVFMVSWFVARHVCYMITLWGIYTYMPATIPVGCYQGSQNNLTGPTPLPEHGWSHTLEPFRNPSGTICHSDNVMWGFLGALGFLQVLTIFWFFLIVQVAIRVVQGIGADDIRSEDDGENTDEEENDSEEVDVGIEPVVSKVWKNRTDLRRNTGSSGVSLPGHRDRKELLSRIGCEKQVE
jgi:acyl-CoA-dependent ceramide synthase